MECLGVGELEVDGGLQGFFVALAVGCFRRGEVAVDVGAPGADATKRAAPVAVGAGAVVEIGEDGVRGGFGGGGGGYRSGGGGWTSTTYGGSQGGGGGDLLGGGGRF